MRASSSLFALATVAAAAAALPAAAQTTDGALAPEVSLRAGLWSQPRELGDPGAVSAAAFAVRTTPRLSASLDAKAEARIQADSSGDTQADLPEAWVRAVEGPVRVTVGRQIVAWGRADRLNPTDVVGSRDYTRLLADDDEQRRGSLMAQASYGTGPWTVSALWLPEFRANRFPVDNPPTGVVILDDQRVRDRGQFAARVDHIGGGLDWSLSYFDGRDRTRDLAAVAPPAGSPAGVFGAVQAQYPAVRVLGGDLAGVAGRYAFRAEASFTDVRGPATPFRKRDVFWAVVGGDRTFDSGWNVNLQYSFRRVFGDRDLPANANPFVQAVARTSAAVNNQLDRTQHGFTARVARSWLHDTLDLECSAAVFAPTGDVAVRPRLTYAVSDQWRATLGADVFRGPKLSYFGRVRDLSAAYVQFAYGF